MKWWFLLMDFKVLFYIFFFSLAIKETDGHSQEHSIPMSCFGSLFPIPFLCHFEASFFSHQLFITLYSTSSSIWIELGVANSNLLPFLSIWMPNWKLKVKSCKWKHWEYRTIKFPYVSIFFLETFQSSKRWPIKVHLNLTNYNSIK